MDNFITMQNCSHILALGSFFSLFLFCVACPPAAHLFLLETDTLRLQEPMGSRPSVILLKQRPVWCLILNDGWDAEFQALNVFFFKLTESQLLQILCSLLFPLVVSLATIWTTSCKQQPLSHNHNGFCLCISRANHSVWWALGTVCWLSGFGKGEILIFAPDCSDS